jgi:hypothetical protein
MVAIDNEVNFRPTFETNKVPCEGEVGDMVVLTALKEGAADPEKDGSASVWFCIKAGRGERPAVWACVQFLGIATCDIPLRKPPQDHEVLKRG